MKDPLAPNTSQARGRILGGGQARAGVPLLLLGALSAIAPLSLDLYLPALPQLEAEFGAGQSTVQLTLTAAAVGLAAGQLIAGPLSDRYGRRAPLLFGLGAYTISTLLSAFAPTVWVLVVIRVLEGLAGASGIVLARAVVRDRYAGTEAARVYALLASVSTAAPVLAPVLGGQLLRVTEWRGVFVALSFIGLILFLATLRRLPETLPPERRAAGGFRTTVTNARHLLGERRFLGFVLTQGFGFGALFTYISTSSFTLQNGYGMTAQQFSLVFAVNGIGIMLGAQLSRLVVRRTGPYRLLVTGLSIQVVGTGVLLVAALTGAGLPVVLPALFVVVACAGLVFSNATALAMSGAVHSAGTAAALLGTGQFAIGAAISPLAGLGEPGTLLPMALVMLGSMALAWLAAVVLGGRPARQPGAVPEPGADPAPLVPDAAEPAPRSAPPAG